MQQKPWAPDVYDYYPGAVSNIRIGVTLVSLMIFLRFWGVHADEPVDWRSISDGTHLYAAADERNGHLASAVMVLYLLFMVGIALTTFMLTYRQKQQLSLKQTRKRSSRKEALKGVVTENVLEIHDLNLF